MIEGDWKEILGILMKVRKVKEVRGFERIQQTMSSIKQRMLQVKMDQLNLEKTLAEANMPANLLELATEVVLKLKLPLDQLPLELKNQIEEWPSKRNELIERKLAVVDKTSANTDCLL